MATTEAGRGITAITEEGKSPERSGLFLELGQMKPRAKRLRFAASF
jgi:hypothetical protein